MCNRHLSRRLIGLFAAYLVALQALILPLSMPALASPAGVLCVTAPDGDGTARHPSTPDRGCPCAAGCGMQCHAPMLGTGATPVVALPQAAIVAVLMPALPSSAPAPLVRGPLMPRGPPGA